MDFLRTPDDRFALLPQFDFQPHYRDVPSGDGGPLRMHFLDEGPRDAATVLLLHGEPTWSFLYRKVIPVLTAAGLRSVAPDLIGFGRSDKPTRRADYTYARHLGWLRSLLDQLGLEDITLLCQDWGGLLGLRLVAETPHLFARVVAANTGLPTAERPPTDAFLAWRKYSQDTRVFHVGGIVKGGCARPLDEAAVAAYDAPFPDDRYLAGARQFPLLVPAERDEPEAEANRAAWQQLARFERPFLTVFGDSDPITAGAERGFQKKVRGAAGQPHRVLKDAGHFLQEDVGEELARATIDFIRQ